MTSIRPNRIREMFRNAIARHMRQQPLVAGVAYGHSFCYAEFIPYSLQLSPSIQYNQAAYNRLNWVFLWILLCGIWYPVELRE